MLGKKILWGLTSVFALTGCKGIEAIESDEDGEKVPSRVERAFEEACATAGCHSGSAASAGLSLEGDALLELVGKSSVQGGGNLVEPGNLGRSYLAQKILGDALPEGTATMPPASIERDERLEENLAVILAWVAGATFESDGAADDGGSGSAEESGGSGEMECFSPTLVPLDPDYESEVYPIFENRCGGGGCHIDASVAMLQFSASDSAMEVIDVPSQGSALDLIEPGAPDESYIWHKIQGTHEAVGGSGGAMPLGGSMCAEEMTTIYRWILNR